MAKRKQTGKAKAKATDDEAELDKPWDNEKMVGISVSHNEQKAARYLGYEDLGMFRTYLCSHMFLDYFLEFTEKAGGKGFRSSAIFKALAAARKDGTMESLFGGSLKDLIKRYPVGPPQLDNPLQKLVRNRLIAGVTYQLVHNEPLFSEDRQNILTEVFQNRCDQKTLRPITEAPPVPKWGPFENEEWGEPYNRAISAFQVFKIDLSRWDERQGKPGGVKSQLIPSTYTPDFMSPQHGDLSETTTGQVQIRPPVEMLELKRFPLYWADDLEVKETLENVHTAIPNFSMDGPDPRCLPGPEWRDKVRVLYEFERLHINFTTIVFRWREDDMDEDMNLLEGDWNRAQELFGRLHQDAIGRIKFKTRPLTPGEVLYEWSGVPTVLSGYMTSSNGRVEMLSGPDDPLPDSPKPSSDESSSRLPPPEAASKKSKEAQESRNNADFINQSLAAVAERLGKKSDPTSGPGRPNPAIGYLKSERPMMLEEHGGVDITDAKLRREWTMKMLIKHGASSMHKTAQNVDSTVMALSGAANPLDDEDPEASSKTDNERQLAFYRLNAALASGPKQAGPDVHLCAVILGCDESAPDRKGRLPTALLGEPIYLYPWQINGVVDLCLKLLGFVPMRGSSEILQAHAKKPEVVHAVERVMGLPISEDGNVRSASKFYRNDLREGSTVLETAGAFLADQTGMGKTILVLFFLSWLVENHEFLGEGENRPALITCPAMLVESWASEAHARFPNLEIALMYADADKFRDPFLVSRRIPTKFTKKLPKLTGCPAWLKPAFENTNRRNPWVIIASIDTLSSRTIQKVPDPSKPKYEVKIRLPDGKEVIRQVEPTKWVSKMKGLVSLVAVDEGHKYRNRLTQAWASIKYLKPHLVLIVSATPMISSIRDMVGLLGLLWKTYFRTELTDEESESISGMDNTELFHFLDSLPSNDIRRRLALDPKKIKSLIKEGSTMVAELFHIAEDLVMLRRNSSSTLPYSTKENGLLPMESFYPKWSVNTISCKHRPSEAQEYQLMHLLAARAFYDFLEQYTSFGEQETEALPETTGPQPKKPKAFPVAALRELAITSCSTKLARLHYQMKNAGLNSRVTLMNELRDKGLGASFLAVMTYQQGDPPYKTRDGLVAFLTEGSPKLRVLYSIVYNTCFLDGRKLLVIEDIPLNAKFFEDSLRALWVHCEVLHSKLTHKQRQELIDSFNDQDSSLQVLIIMVEVSSQGLNLQRASNRVISMIPAKRSNPQVQAETRVLRADQEHSVEILRVILENSHDQYREARQTSNIRLEIATKAHLPHMREELVKVLNESQEALRRLKESPRARSLMDVAQLDQHSEDEDTLPDNSGSKESREGGRDDEENNENDDEENDEENDDEENDDEENDDEELAIETNLGPLTDAMVIDEDENKDPSYNYIEISDSSDSEEESEDESEEELSESGESIADLAVTDEDLPDILTMSREEREAFNQDEFFLKRMLKRNSDYVFTDVDLANEPILNRAIDLLHHKRQGQNDITQVLGVHINYDALPEDIKGAATSEKDFALRKEGKLRLEQKKTAMKRLRIPWVKNDTKGQVSVPKQKQQGLSSGPVQQTATKANKGKRAVRGGPSGSKKRQRTTGDP